MLNLNYQKMIDNIIIGCESLYQTITAQPTVYFRLGPYDYEDDNKEIQINIYDLCD